MVRPIRVLVDLSMTGRGYCGIAQDVRLLYKTLAERPEIEVTGLVYRPQKFARPHRFTGGTRRDQRIANHAEFLWKLSESSVQWSSWRMVRLYEQALAVGDTLLARRPKVEPLDTDKFWPTLWRLLFSQTLPAEDQPLVRDGKFLLSDASDGKVFARTFSRRKPLEVDTRGYDFFVVQGPRAFRPSPGTQLIVRYHDMIPVLEPDTMGNPLVISWHERALRENSGYFVCNSEPTREDLVRVHPDLAGRSSTIPYMLSHVYLGAPRGPSLRSILETRQSPACGRGRPLRRAPKYLLTVSTIEPRKNYLALLQAFNQLKSRPGAEKLKLVIVGSPGWRYEPILAAMRPLVERGHVIHLEGVAASELRVLYSRAEAFVFPSTAEGFGFPPLEAMACGLPVVASDLPAHRWVLGDAALYCDPLQTSSICAALEQLVTAADASVVRSKLIQRGREQAAIYSLENCGRQWVRLLEQLRDGVSGVAPAPIADDALRLRIAG